jgi:hypothetical protein
MTKFVRATDLDSEPVIVRAVRLVVGSGDR